MSALSADDLARSPAHPLDLVEDLALANDWVFERGDDEIAASVAGSYCEFQLRFLWRDEANVLQLACVVEGRVTPPRRPAVYEALCRMNEQLWLGHLELWSSEDRVVFRYSAVADGARGGLTGEQIAAITETALTQCERFYPVFQFVVWGGKNPREAIDAAMLETAGEA